MAQADIYSGAELALFAGTSASDPTTDDYKEVVEVNSYGPYGGQNNEITFENQSTGETEYLSGSTDYGNLNVTCGYVRDDPGQQRLRDARASRTEINVFLFDRKTGEAHHFRVTPMSDQINPGSNAAAKTQDFTLRLRSAPDVNFTPPSGTV